MTPTPTLLLFVALFWTVPASLAAYAYRRNGRSIDNMKEALLRAVDDATAAFSTEEASARLDA